MPVAEDQEDADLTPDASEQSPDEDPGAEQVTEEPPTAEEDSEEEEQKD